MHRSNATPIKQAQIVNSPDRITKAEGAVVLAAAAPTSKYADLNVARRLLDMRANKPYSALPKKKNGKPISFSTVLRWCTRKESRGFTLRTLRVGGALCTSDQWALAFVDALTNKTSPPPTRTEGQREKQVRRAEEQLEQAGI